MLKVIFGSFFATVLLSLFLIACFGCASAPTPIDLTPCFVTSAVWTDNSETFVFNADGTVVINGWEGVWNMEQITLAGYDTIIWNDGYSDNILHRME